MNGASKLRGAHGLPAYTTGFALPPLLVMAALVSWTLALGGSLFWNLKNDERALLDTAYAEAGAIRDKDMAFRRWAMRHSGVYVPVTEKEQPSPHMAHVPRRDVRTADGQDLTLRAPAIMVREMMDDFANHGGKRGRITGLRYLNPANAPDAWERTQLEAFTRGEKNEVWEVADIDGKPYLRYLSAWRMEAVCVQCHAILGYQVGDMRGATGVSLPLAPYYERHAAARANLILTHGTLWLLGLIGIGWSGREMRERTRERRKADDILRLHASIFEHSGEAIVVTDRDNLIVAINPALERLTGYSLDDLRGLNPRALSAGTTTPETYAAMWRSLLVDGHWQGELWDQRKDGSQYPKWVNISLIRDANGNVSHHVASFTDISERRKAEEHIYRLAHHDSLTGLYNRHSLEDRLGQALATAQRERSPLAVMFIDLDRFKRINDSLGHSVGDALLIEVARRLCDLTRQSDVVARLGGDEFVVALTGLETTSDAMVVAGKILHALAQPYTIDGNVLHCSGSIGVTLYPDDGDNIGDLMRNADTAMYHAKDSGRNGVEFFTAGMNALAAERLELEEDLRAALEADQFELHYQPKVDAIGGSLDGYEALLRWHHPQRGMISPLKFIPIAEETGLIERLGAWVIDRACRQIAVWHGAGGQGIRVAVNLSAHQLRSRELASEVRAALERHAVAAESLELEITESAAMSDPEQAIGQLHALRAIGVTLAIDDFGTGYSSLAYLKMLPIQVLKIDRAFVSDIETDANDAAICAATIALAKSLGLKVVAEGVETEAQREFLVGQGCDILQGYLFGKPEPADRCVGVGIGPSAGPVAGA